MSIDTRYFVRKLREQHLSQRQLAKRLGLDHSAVVRMLHGERQMRLTEAADIARVIGVDVRDVLKHAGVHTAPGTRQRQTPIVGFIDGTGEAHLDWNTHAAMIACPPELPEDTVAVQYRTAGSAWEPFDGWIAYVRPSSNIAADAVGRQCLLELQDGVSMIGFLRRGYSPGKFNVLNFGAPSVENARVTWASPVLLVRPS